MNKTKKFRILLRLTRLSAIVLALTMAALFGLYTKSFVHAEGEPITVITSKPDSSSYDPMPEFAFVADVPGSTFECWLDTQPAVSCTSPFVLPEPLTEGEHTFNVRAAAPGSEIFNSSATVYPWTFAWDANAVTDIHSCVELQQIGNDFNYSPDSDYRLAHDIDCSDTVNWNSGAGWDPIGSFGSPFTGTLDGNGHSILDLVVNLEPGGPLGLFSYTQDATFLDFTITGSVTNPSVSLSTCMGGLVGYARGYISISDVNSKMDLTATDNTGGGFIGCMTSEGGSSSFNNSTYDGTLATGASGGLIGEVHFSGDANMEVGGVTTSGTITADAQAAGIFAIYTYVWDDTSGGYNLAIFDTTSDMDITGSTYVAGFVGALSMGELGSHILDSSFTGTLESSSGTVGGLIGLQAIYTNENTSTITRSYVSSGITANGDNVGGLVGVTIDGQSLDIEESYFGGIISNTGSHVGGLVGKSDGVTTITNSYTDAVLDGNTHIGGLVGSGNETVIDNSYAFTQIDSTASVLGGLVGSLTNGNITNSFASTNIASAWMTTVGGLVGGISGGTIANSYTDTDLGSHGCRFTGDIENPSTIDCTDISQPNYFFGNSIDPPMSEWDFDTVWTTNTYFYPCLRWQENCQTFEPQVVCEMPTATTTTISGACDIQVRSGYDYGTTTWVARYKKISDSTYLPITLADDTIADATVVGLSPNTGYYLEFQFTNNWGTGEWSRIDFVTTNDSGFNIDMSSAEDGSLINFDMAGCESLGDWRTQKESELSSQDPAYSYPQGLIKFNLINCPLGGQATVRLTFTTSKDPDSFVVRKVDDRHKSFTTLTSENSNLTKARVTMDGKAAIRVEYKITDGGYLDQDGVVNSQILDPVGLATSVVGPPNTGLGGVL